MWFLDHVSNGAALTKTPLSIQSSTRRVETGWGRIVLVTCSLLTRCQTLTALRMHRLDVPADSDQPVYHVGPPAGWTNDPNGPVFYDGHYHLFYQHVPTGCEWSFGLVWGHAMSTDLVNWVDLPPALAPTPGTADADGCFSGCTVVVDGTPVVLYTGVRKRSNPDCGPLPPPECDLHLPFIESQCAAVGLPGQTNIESLQKLAHPIIPLPPADMDLLGWRDPFCLSASLANSAGYSLLIGTGMMGQGGAVLLYKSKELTTGWEYCGIAAKATSRDTGDMWECPLLVEVPAHPAHGHGATSASCCANDQHIMSSVSPLQKQHHTGLKEASANQLVISLNASCGAGACPDSMCLDATTGTDSTGAVGGGTRQESQDRCHLLCISPDNPGKSVLYWLGHYDGSYFDVAAASGPHWLDLGDIVYAPNCLHDPQGRLLLWGWLQERRKKIGTYSYAGCLSLPRVLTLNNGKLHQAPAHELTALRQKQAVRLSGIDVMAGQPVQLEGNVTNAVDIELEIERGDAMLAGVHIRSWAADTEAGMAVLVNWESGTLEAVFEAVDPGTGSFSLESPAARSFGGAIDTTGDTVRLRVLLDHSAVEVYSGCGQVLSTRVYRGVSPDPADSGLDLVAFGGCSTFRSVDAWPMRSAWVPPPATPVEVDAVPVTPAELDAALEDWVVVDNVLTELHAEVGEAAGRAAEGEVGVAQDVALPHEAGRATEVADVLAVGALCVDGAVAQVAAAIGAASVMSELVSGIAAIQQQPVNITA